MTFLRVFVVVNMDTEKHEAHKPERYSERALSDDNRLKLTQSTVDKLEVTKQRPYKEINFIGTYVAVCLGALACYGGFVMPATSLALIEQDIGKRKAQVPVACF